jgi:hypothetical protein
MTVELFSLWLQITGLVGVIAFSIVAKHQAAKVVFAGVLMFIVNIIGQLLIAGGGPKFGLGCIGLPVLCVMAALATDWFVSVRRERPEEKAGDGE